LIVYINALQDSSEDFSKTPTGVAVLNDEKRAIDNELNLTYRYIQYLFIKRAPAQPTGARGVGETKGAGKFMHYYHAKRFL
jgi:hypothetical protein